MTFSSAEIFEQRRNVGTFFFSNFLFISSRELQGYGESWTEIFVQVLCGKCVWKTCCFAIKLKSWFISETLTSAFIFKTVLQCKSNCPCFVRKKYGRKTLKIPEKKRFWKIRFSSKNLIQSHHLLAVYRLRTENSMFVAFSERCNVEQQLILKEVVHMSSFVFPRANFKWQTWSGPTTYTFFQHRAINKYSTPLCKDSLSQQPHLDFCIASAGLSQVLDVRVKWCAELQTDHRLVLC